MAIIWRIPRLDTTSTTSILLTLRPQTELITSTDAFSALLAIKTLGKEPIGSEVIATSANLSTLLALSRSLKDDADASNEALRCIANALLLISDARDTFIRNEVGGGEAAADLLEVRPEVLFCCGTTDFRFRKALMRNESSLHLESYSCPRYRWHLLPISSVPSSKPSLSAIRVILSK